MPEGRDAGKNPVAPLVIAIPGGATWEGHAIGVMEE